jgi:hypothetical protein
MKNKSSALASAIIFAADACFELGRVALGRPWPGLAPTFSYFVSLGLATAWSTAAALQLARFRNVRLNTSAELVAIGGVLLMVIHASMTRVLGSFVGLANLALALTQVFLLRRFDQQLRPKFDEHRA